MHRLVTFSESGREDAFRDGIRDRDRKCVFSGVENRLDSHGIWVGFEAAHSFPVQSESYWNANHYERFVTDMDNTTGVSKVHSCQKGFLMN